MQVAKRNSTGKNYATVDSQSVLIHPSTVLKVDAEWVVYHEFVLTTKNFIRTVTVIKPEWLIDIAPNYYDLDNFRDGELKTAIQRTMEKMRRREAGSKRR